MIESKPINLAMSIAKQNKTRERERLVGAGLRLIDEPLDLLRVPPDYVLVEPMNVSRSTMDAFPPWPRCRLCSRSWSEERRDPCSRTPSWSLSRGLSPLEWGGVGVEVEVICVAAAVVWMSWIGGVGQGLPLSPASRTLSNWSPLTFECHLILYFVETHERFSRHHQTRLLVEGDICIYMGPVNEGVRQVLEPRRAVNGWCHYNNMKIKIIK